MRRKLCHLAITVVIFGNLMAAWAGQPLKPWGGQEILNAPVGMTTSLANPVSVSSRAKPEEMFSVRAHAGREVAQYAANSIDLPSDDTQVISNTGNTPQAIVTIRRAICKPEEVRPGETVTVEMEYSVTAPRDSPPVYVEESWVLEKDDNVLTKFPPKRILRPVGKWLADAKIPIPQGAEPGAYFVIHRVQAGESYDKSGSFFFVAEPEKGEISRGSKSHRSGVQ